MHIVEFDKKFPHFLWYYPWRKNDTVPNCLKYVTQKCPNTLRPVIYILQ